jgi:hypothetical protein
MIERAQTLCVLKDNFFLHERISAKIESSNTEFICVATGVSYEIENLYLNRCHT